MSDKEAQEDELLALASIYDEHTFVSTSDGDIPGGQFSAQIELPQPFHVKFISKGTEKEYELQYLPPLVLNFNLPNAYPSICPPNFTLSCKWLTMSQLSRLCGKLDEIWGENEGEVILFLWTSFLKEEVLEFLTIASPLDLSNVVASKTSVKVSKKKTFDKQSDSVSSDCKVKVNTALKHMGISDSSDSGICDTSSLTALELFNVTDGKPPGIEGIIDPEKSAKDIDSILDAFNEARGICGADAFLKENDPRAIQDIAAQELLLPNVLEHEASYREFVFKSTLYTCQVCFQEKLGALCIQFVGCRHVYCKECMTGYFTVQINEGSVKNLTCPYDKCDSQAHPSQVGELVDKELFTRYERLLLQLSLDTMSDIVYCPRKACNCAVMVDTDNMGSCSACSYVFCVFCKMAYHGVSPCKLRPEEMKSLRNEYENASSEQKKFMEQRYGKHVIRKAIHESYTNEWLDEFSKKCPHCGTHIQKMDGCNKMTCTKCHQHFCWLCSCSLSKVNPYSHFNMSTSKCFNMLFHGVIVNDDDDFYDDDDEF